MRTQEVFDPTDFGFEFTPDGWYKFDRKAGHKAALKARNARVKELREAGYAVATFTLPGQLRTLGGINTPHPEIEEVVNCYGLNIY